jgi:uncharacterized protein involved in high-affinity Fe2+ transport
MKNIYSTCTTDVVWLGEATGSLTHALEIAAQLQRSDIESMANVPWMSLKRVAGPHYMISLSHSPYGIEFG